jgi:hypothetical protein
MNPIRLKGLTPDEFERLCLELVQKSFHTTAMRRGGISDSDQGIDIEATLGPNRLGIQCKTGRLSVGILRDTLRQLIRYPHRIDRFILMCAQHPVPSAIDEFRQWSSNAETTQGLISTVELWDPDRIVSELDAHPGLLERITEASWGPVFAIPIPRPIFKGREAELAYLFESLNKGKTVQVAVSIVGLGGIGKTTLAAEYAYRFRDSYPGGVYWINAKEDIPAQCARLGLLAGVSKLDTEPAVAARTFLETRKRAERSLIIIDDLDRPNLLNQPIVDGLSLAECQSEIIITSRFTGLLASGVSRLELAALSERDSLALLARASNRPDLLKFLNPDHMVALELCRELGHLPLAINMAGSFLAAEPNKTVSAYLEILRSQGTLFGIDASDAEALHLSHPTEASLSASLKLAYEAVLDDDAKRLFQVLCLLPEKQSVNKDMIPLLLGRLENGLAKKSIAWLTNSGLINIDDAGNINLHPIVRSFGTSMLDANSRSELAALVGESVRKGIVSALSPKDTSKEEPKSLHRVFLCYAGPDRNQVEAIYNKLSKDGFSPWMDKKSLLPGQDWKLEIKRAIETADFFVACISQHFQERTYGHKEIKLALEILDMMPEGTIFLIPLRLENCPLDDRLSSRHWVDLFEPGGYELLVRALSSH